MSTEPNPPGFTLTANFRGHLAFISRMAWSPNGHQLITSSLDATARVWETGIGMAGRILRGHKSPLHDAILIDDGITALTCSSDRTIRKWNVASGVNTDIWKGHTDVVACLAVTPNEQHVISGSHDNTIRVWNAQQNKELFSLRGHFGSVYGIAVTDGGTRIVSASVDRTIKYWDMENEKCIATLRGHNSFLWDIALQPQNNVVATASADKTIRLWYLAENGVELFRVIEGHTGFVVGVSFSADGSVMVSKSLDGTVRLWRCDTWEPIAILREEHFVREFARPVFHPRDPRLLATLDNKGKSVRIWELDYDEIFENVPENLTVNYTTAKIALVGESGVGKSGLGYRIATGEFQTTESTHGQQFWTIHELGISRSDGTECEAILWDFAGQPDYKLVHALFLDDVDIALLLFDASDQSDPLKGVEFWLRQFDSKNCKKVLVASRVDRGSPAISKEEILDFCNRYNITGGYIETSAKTGRGISNLLSRIRTQIDWETKIVTSTTYTFKRIREYILHIKENLTTKNRILSWTELRSNLKDFYSKDLETWSFTNSEMRTAVQHLQTHGYLTILRGIDEGEALLFAPDLQTKLASSFILEARRNPNGLGALEENSILDGTYKFHELEGMPSLHRDLLLDSTIALFVRSNICQREHLETKNLLLYPSLINQKRSSTEEFESVTGTSYIIQGAVEGVYASLVVLIGYTDLFRRTNQWRNYAQYEREVGQICGLHLVQDYEGQVEIALYYAKSTPVYVKQVFSGLIETFLNQRNLNYEKFPPVLCGACEAMFERNIIIRMLNQNRDKIFCNECGHPTNLQMTINETNIMEADRKIIDQQHRITAQRTQYAEILTYVKRVIRQDQKDFPSCFISYAWGNEEQEKWVAQLADDLREADIEVIIDIWNNRVGDNLNSFMSHLSEYNRSNFVILIGTELYLEKYQNKNPQTGSAVAAEVDLINERIVRGTKEERNSILPILLEGDYKMSIPPLVRGRVYLDFRDNENYFDNLFSLILRLYELDIKDDRIRDLHPSKYEVAGVM